MKRYYLLIIPLILLPYLVFSQINGKIVDGFDDSPLPFATVLGKNKYAIANENGEFNYRGRIGDRLTISYLGYRDAVE